MGRLIAIEFISIDGVIQAPGHAGEPSTHSPSTGPPSPPLTTWANTTVIAGQVAERIAEAKAMSAGPLLLTGSSQLAHTLTNSMTTPSGLAILTYSTRPVEPSSG